MLTALTEYISILRFALSSRIQVSPPSNVYKRYLAPLYANAAATTGTIRPAANKPDGALLDMVVPP
jgi:hypothetical protein